MFIIQLFKQIKSRRTMRHFSNTKIPFEIIQKINEVGRYTPTGKNRQMVSYRVLHENIAEFEDIAIKTFRLLKSLSDFFSSKYRFIKIDNQFLFKKAPLVIVIKSTDRIDGALVASVMELTAQSMGLGVLYSGFFTEIARKSRKLKKMLKMNRKKNRSYSRHRLSIDSICPYGTMGNSSSLL